VIFTVDVHARGSDAVAAKALTREWEDDESVAMWVVAIPAIGTCGPGQLYRSELPCILELLKQVEPLPNTVIIDGHVYLDAGKVRLGAALIRCPTR
jgi:deoxyribonuclease V